MPGIGGQAPEPNPSPAESYVPAISGQAPGQPARLPIIGGPEHQLQVRDKAWVPADAFGRTWSETTYEVPVQRSPIIDAFMVSGAMNHVINWGVRRGTGPQNQVDITSHDDPDITADNYRKVADDLQPGKGNQPPRRNFFASDLTMRHELFHVMHHIHFYRIELEAGVRWLNRHQATTEQQVNRLVERMMTTVDRHARFRTGSDTDTGQSAEENAAYDAGAPAYQARADAIRRKGRAGGYPP